MKTIELNRHDIPEEIKELINVAIKEDVVDPIGLYTLAVNCGTNWSILVDNLVDAAYSWIHCDTSIGRDAYPR